MLRGLQEYDQLKNTIWHAQLSFSKMKYNKEKIAYYTTSKLFWDMQNLVKIGL